MSIVFSVHKSETYTFSKESVESIQLIEGEGVEDDAHCGVTVKHRYRVKKDPTQPNLRQVHLIHHELIESLQSQGFHVAPGAMGENITTSGLDILVLPTDTILHIGANVQIQVTGLRNPCYQLDNYEQGLMTAVLDHDEEGNLIRLAGIMAIVLQGGVVSKGDTIEVELPSEPHRPLLPV